MSPWRHIPAIVMLLASLDASYGQPASSWRTFKPEDGLEPGAAFSVNVTPQGNVFAVQSNAIILLDGYGAQKLPPSGISGRVHQSASGQSWMASPAGLFELRDARWLCHPLAEITNAYLTATNSTDGLDVPPIYPVRQGHVLFLLPECLMEYNVEDPAHPRVTPLYSTYVSGLGKFCSLKVTHDGSLWLGGEFGLAHAPGPVRDLTAKTAWQEFPLPSAWRDHIRWVDALEEDEDGDLTCLADSVGFRNRVLRLERQSWRAQYRLDAPLQRAWQDPDGTHWLSHGGSLSHYPDATLTNGVLADSTSTLHLNDISVEPSGVFWLATDEGLSRHAPPLWQKPAAVGPSEAPVDALTEGAGGQLWFVTGRTLHRLSEGRSASFELPPDAVPAAGTQKLYPAPGGGVLWPMSNGLLHFDLTSGWKSVAPPGDQEQLLPLGLLKNGTVCLKLSGKDRDDCRLAVYDGKSIHPFPVPQPDKAWCATATSLFAAWNGELWLAGERGIAHYHDQAWQWFPCSDKYVPAPARAFAELPDDKIVCATADKLWQFDGRNWSTLRAGFTDITSLLCMRDGSLWVASSGGVARFILNTWLQHGPEEGLPSLEARQLLEDSRGRLWVATAGGLCRFHPEADPDGPKVFIRGLEGTDARLQKGMTVSLTLEARDRWKFTADRRLLVCYRLDDREWSPFDAPGIVQFKDLPTGKHYLQARAMDRNANLNDSVVQLDFTVVGPWYEESRTVVIAALGLAGVLFFAGLAVNRHLRLRRSYAEVERKIAERTRELELANRELLHSQKMNALGTLAAGIAHDFNNILSIIRGSAQIIEDNLENNPESRQKILTRLDRIKTVVHQGSGIVEAMLGFSRSSEQDLTPCDLNTVVQNTVTLLGDRFLREVKVRFEPGANLPPTVMTQDFVQQILLNFIFNAAEAMIDTKEVVLSTQQLAALPSGMALSPAEAKAYLAVAVKDSGSGIAPENLVRIFEPFFTTKAFSTRRGTGLGLSMVYELAKKLQAGIAVESTPGQGSTFTLILPVRDVPATSTQPAP